MSDSMAKISSILESAKTLTTEAAAAATQKVTQNPADIKRLLSSRIERDVSLGMKSVVSLMAKGEDCRDFFAGAVKNITSPSIKIRNLVMIYLVAYADAEPETVLLSINSIQRFLTDSNPAIRSKSIRILADIQMPSIVPILALSLKRLVSDSSPIVRAATAVAISSSYKTPGSDRKLLFEHLCKLLTDQDLNVVSLALAAFTTIQRSQYFKPTMWAPIHGHFRRLSTVITEFDEWGQTNVIELLTEYSRLFLAKPKSPKSDFHNESYQDLLYDVDCDQDLRLFINLLKPIIYSNSDCVVLAALRALYNLMPMRTIEQFQFDIALLRVMSTNENPLVILPIIGLVSRIIDQDASVFASKYKYFYVSPSENHQIAVAKIGILLKLLNESNFKYIFQEVKYYAMHSVDLTVAKFAVDCMGYYLPHSAECRQVITLWCLRKLKSNQCSHLMSNFSNVLRIQLQTIGSKVDLKCDQYRYQMILLLSILSDSSINVDGDAKSSIVWMINDFGIKQGERYAHEALKILLKDFAHHPHSVRYQCLMLASKLFTFEMENHIKSGSKRLDEIDEISSLFQHTLLLARYDSNFDTRDRARMIQILLNKDANQLQLASLFLQAPKPAPNLKKSGCFIVASRDISLLNEYLKTSEWLDPSSLPPLSVRKELPLTNHNRSLTGISTNIAPVTHASSASAIQAPVNDKSNKQQGALSSYKLQSLDEFFGDTDSLAESDDESNNSSTCTSAGSCPESDETRNEESNDEYSDLDDSSKYSSGTSSVDKNSNDIDLDPELCLADSNSERDQSKVLLLKSF